MIKAIFEPIWDNFTLSPVTESFGVNISTPFFIRATINLAPGEGSIEIDDADISFLTSVKKDEVIEAYTITGNILSMAITPDRTAIVEIERSGTVDYSIFVGEIVPGITIDSSGHLTGIVDNIPFTSTHTYTFGLRGQWGDKTADVIQSWDAIPEDNQISWNAATLPTQEVNSGFITGRPFYTIGEFKRGQVVDITIDLYNPDLTPLTVQGRSVSEMVTGANIFSGLPLGLSISNNPFDINGFIPAEAVAGDYFIEVYIDQDNAPPPIILHAVVLANEYDTFTAINRISWVTDTDLGIVMEGHPIPFTVTAQNSAGGSVTYTLAAGSRPLPKGIILASNGELQGVAPHVSTNTIFDFDVKASSGPYVSTNPFSFQISNSFVKPNHLTVSLPFTGYIRRDWQAYSGQINSTIRFRSDDPNFGDAAPRILLIRGLNAVPITGLEYDKPFQLIAGEFKVAQVIANNTVLYDVIYREFFDPLYRAGGFVNDPADVIESTVYYPENHQILIEDPSIHNLRCDLVINVGLNTSISKQGKLGLTGGELLDPWMLSIQADNTQIGYVIAGVIDYLLPNMGAGIVNELTYDALPVGTEIAFDRFLVEQDTASYLYYLGWNRNDDSKIEVTTPPIPYGVAVDGVPIAQSNQIHPEPNITWSSADANVTFILRFYNGNTLLRTAPVDNTSFLYTTAMQQADNLPGHVTVDITAVKDSIESDPVIAEITLHGGWGYGWGYHYGAAN